MATIRFIYRPVGLNSSPQPSAALDTRPPTVAGPDSVPPAEVALERVKVDRWWRESSFDLWQGLEVREDPPDTMPAQWLDEFEQQQPASPPDKPR